eukprot:975470-Rhodomonas_salina.2
MCGGCAVAHGRRTDSYGGRFDSEDAHTRSKSQTPPMLLLNSTSPSSEPAIYPTSNRPLPASPPRVIKSAEKVDFIKGERVKYRQVPCRPRPTTYDYGLGPFTLRFQVMLTGPISPMRMLVGRVLYWPSVSYA